MKDYHYDFSQLYMLLQMAKGDRTAKEWAQAAGITEASLSRMMSGKQPVKLSAIEKLSAAGLRGGVTKEDLIDAITPMSKPVTDDVNQMDTALDSLIARFRKGAVDTSLFRDVLDVTEKANQFGMSIRPAYIDRAVNEMEGKLVFHLQDEWLFFDQPVPVRIFRKKDLTGYSDGRVTPDVHFSYLQRDYSAQSESNGQENPPDGCSKDSNAGIAIEYSAYAILTAGMSFEERQAQEELLDAILQEHQTVIDANCNSHNLFFAFDEKETYTLFRTWIGKKALPKDWCVDIAMIDFDDQWFSDWINVKGIK